LCVERRVEIGELHLAEVLPSELREPREARQSMERITSDQQVVSGSSLPDRADRRKLVEEPDLSDPVIGRLQPFV
jgi:hypothetical protein